MSSGSEPVLLFLVTEDWYFVSHRLALATAAARAGFRVVVATRLRKHAATLRAAGCDVVPLEWVRATGNPLGELRFLFALIRLYRRLKPQVVHHVAIKPVVYGSIAARLSGVPIVVNAIAGLGYVFTSPSWPARALRPLIRAAFRFLLNRPGTWVILQNPDDQALLIREARLEAGRAVLIRGAGVDLAEFHPAAEPSGVPVVMLPSRMLWDKGIGEFVAAARQLRADGIAARFVLVGGLDGDNRRAIDAETLNLWVKEGSVEWWGHRSPMSTTLGEATIITLPSFYGEGIPKALIEAAACGKPIITTDTPGCREVVSHGDNGLLVPPRDPAALATAIRQLLEEPALRGRMGRRGRERAEAEFDVGGVVRATLPLYQHGPDW